MQNVWCCWSSRNWPFIGLQIYAGSNSGDIEESNGGNDSATSADSVLSIEGNAGAESDDDHCAICLGKYVIGDEIASSHQGCHIFHQACITDWLQRKNCCPCCRRRFLIPNRPELVQEEHHPGGSEVTTNPGAPQDTPDNEQIDVWTQIIKLMSSLKKLFTTVLSLSHELLEILAT